MKAFKTAVTTCMLVFSFSANANLNGEVEASAGCVEQVEAATADKAQADAEYASLEQACQEQFADLMAARAGSSKHARASSHLGALKDRYMSRCMSGNSQWLIDALTF